MAAFFQIFNLDFIPPSPFLINPAATSKPLPTARKDAKIGADPPASMRKRQRTMNPAGMVLYLFDLDIVPPSPHLTKNQTGSIPAGLKPETSAVSPNKTAPIPAAPKVSSVVSRGEDDNKIDTKIDVGASVAKENGKQVGAVDVVSEEKTAEAGDTIVEGFAESMEEGEGRLEEEQKVSEEVKEEEAKKDDSVSSPVTTEPEGEQEEQKSEPESSLHSQDELLSPPVPITPLPTVYGGRNEKQRPEVDEVQQHISTGSNPALKESIAKGEESESSVQATFKPELEESGGNRVFLRSISFFVFVAALSYSWWTNSSLALPAAGVALVVLVYEYSQGWGKVLWFYCTLFLSKLLKRVHRPTSIYLRELSRDAYASLQSMQPPSFRRVKVQTVQNDVADSITLYSTLYLPVEEDAGEEKQFPCVVIRTPYGRDYIGKDTAHALAERGYACLLQDTRGRFGSGGDFFPVKDEIHDGGKTIKWATEQAWCNGKVGLYGVSYLGLTAYAAAGSGGGKHVAAIMPVASCASTHSVIYHNGDGGPLALELTMKWLWLAVKLMNSAWYAPIKFFVPVFHGEVNKPMNTMPLCEQDKVLVGKELAFYQEAIRYNSPTHEFWHDKDILCDLSLKPQLPNHIICGWFDFFLKQSFADFSLLKNSGNPHAAITVFDRHHWNILSAPVHSLCLDWFDRHLKPESNVAVDKAPRIQMSVVGVKKLCLGFSEWPPARSSLVEYYLSCSGRLSLSKPKEQGSFTSHVYDPSKPTPSVGGPSFDFSNVGSVVQNKLEARPDVITFTSEVLAEDVYVVGDVKVRMNVDSSNPYTDFFFKLCDVNTKGKSYNVCEHIVRLYPSSWKTGVGGNGYSAELQETISPIAVRFKRGHRIRLQVSGGAHPLYMRNLGVSESFHTAKTTRKAVHRIHHSLRAPSCLYLPILSSSEMLRHAIRPVDSK